MNEGLTGLSREARKVFKRAFDELDTIRESANRQGMKKVKEEGVFDLV